MNRKANNANARHAGMRRRPHSGPAPGPTPSPASGRVDDEDDATATRQQIKHNKSPGKHQNHFVQQSSTVTASGEQQRGKQGQAGEQGREIDSGTVAPSIRRVNRSLVLYSLFFINYHKPN